MKHPLYKQSIAFGWRMLTGHFHLWPYGLFALFLGQFGLSELLTKVGVVTQALDDSLVSYAPSMFVQVFANTDWSWGNIAMFSWFAIIMIGVAGMLLFAAVSSQGALMHEVARQTKKNKKPHTLSTSWHVGMDHFWRLFALNALRKGTVALTALCLAILSMKTMFSSSFLGTVGMLIAFVAAIIVGMVISFWTYYASGYVVVQEYGLGQALKEAWRILKDHWLVSLEIASMLLIIQLVVSVIVTVLVLVLFIPFVIFHVLATVLASQVLLFIGYGLTMLATVSFMAVVGTWQTIFFTSVWMYLFMHMHKHGMSSRLLHVLSRGKISFGH